MDGAPNVSDIILSPTDVTAFESAVAAPVTEFAEIHPRPSQMAQK